jgi:hypothetical protein
MHSSPLARLSTDIPGKFPAPPRHWQARSAVATPVTGAMVTISSPLAE